MLIAVIHGNDGSDVRVGKVCRFLTRLGHEVHFIGWDRRPLDEKKIDLGGTTRNVLVRATKYGKATLFGHLAFMAHVIGKLGQIRPDVVSCVNEDIAFLLLPFRGVFYRYLVCDVFDALVDRHSGRAIMLPMLKAVSEIVRWKADRLIATDVERGARFGRHRHKVEVVENVPEDPGEDLSRQLPKGNIKVCAAGSLMESRGLKYLLDAVEQVEGIEILSAGWPYDNFAEKVFIKHPRVTFRGVLTARQCLEMASQCDAVFSYYAPISVNNLYASPNKIYDAMSVGRPVIINSEVRVAHFVEEKGLGWTCDYDNVTGLTELLMGLAKHREDLSKYARRLRAIYLEAFTWEAKGERLRRMYDELGDRR